MSDTYSYYLTDSTNFRILFGQYSEGKFFRSFITTYSIKVLIEKSMTVKSHIHLFLLFASLCTGCKGVNQSQIDSGFIKSISEEANHPLPSKYNNCYFFIRCDSTKIAETNLSELRYIYEHKYASISYSAFLDKAFNGVLTGLSIQTENCFYLNSLVYKQYQENSFDDFLAIYKDKTRSNYLTLQSSDPGLKTLLYLLFINNYCVSFDDYLGRFTYVKNSDI